MNRVQTDNSHISAKINLRLKNLPNKDEIKVLDAFCGDGKIWREIKNLSNKKITLLMIDKKIKSRILYLKGDNIKFLAGMNLNEFDIIDLDAYGIPYNQMEILFKKNYNGIVFVTYIQSGMGGLPKKFLYELGYSKAMIDKIPTLFYKNGFNKLKQYLALKGVREIQYYRFNQKIYLYYKTQNKGGNNEYNL